MKKPTARPPPEAESSLLKGVAFLYSFLPFGKMDQISSNRRGVKFYIHFEGVNISYSFSHKTNTQMKTIWKLKKESDHIGLYFQGTYIGRINANGFAPVDGVMILLTSELKMIISIIENFDLYFNNID